jgi:hypothetical protein
LSIAAQRDAAAGDAAAQWLLGSLYLFGLGVPKDHDAGIKWIEAATRTAIPALRAAMNGPLSEMELFAIMLNAAQEALPELVRRDGTAWGVAAFKQQARTILQAMSPCIEYPSTR